MVDLLILTSCIAPCKQELLALQDKDTRFKQTIECIKRFVDSGTFKKILICDGSNINLQNHFIAEYAESKGILFESLSFQQDNKSVKFKGKGYGEGEIMDFLVNNSRLFEESDSFIKVTGRLFVSNIVEINNNLCLDRIYFNYIPSKRIGCVDTRLYAMPTFIYRKYFQESYKDVNDYKCRSYEICFTDTLRDNKLTFSPLPFAPVFWGISGTNNKPYTKDISYFIINKLTSLGIMNTMFAGLCLWLLRAYTVIVSKVK